MVKLIVNNKFYVIESIWKVKKPVKKKEIFQTEVKDAALDKRPHKIRIKNKK